MVAGGAGGGWYSDASGGGLYGLAGRPTSYVYYTMVGKAGSQTSGGATPTMDTDCAQSNGTAGGFGYGGTGGKNASSAGWGGGGGGGGGYFGGSGGSGCCNGVFPGGGGSSFISGYAGVNAITSSSSRTLTYNTLHYSNKYFVDGEMQTGVNIGNGKAKITFLSSVKPKRTNKTLDGVRYIKDCINGSNTAYTSNHWVELQAIYNGTNVAKGKTATGTATISNASYITNGDITSSNYADITSGTQCITIDLGQEYDLDEIAVWHYWSDGRTYNNNITYVSNDNSSWIVAINRNEAETSQGKRVSAYDTLLLTISSTNGTLSCKNNTTGLTSTTELSVVQGDSITCTATPDTWYKLSTLKIDSTSYTSGTSFTYNYVESKTITATYTPTDTTAPATPTLTNSSGGNWTTSSVTITASSTDTESGIYKIQYSYDNSTWYEDWNSTSTITNGKKVSGTWSAVRDATVYIRAIDNVGNVSASATTQVRIKEAELTCNCNYRSTYTISTGSWSCSCGSTHTKGYIHYCVCSNGETYSYNDYATYSDGSYIVTHRWVCPIYYSGYTGI